MSLSEFKKSFPAYTEIFAEGDDADCAYIIEKGAIEISMNSDGKPVLIATLTDGDLLGEMALIDDKPRNATAISVKAVELIVIPKSYIKKKIRLSDPTLRFFLQVVMARYRDVHSRLLHVVEHLGSGNSSTKETETEDTSDVVKNLVEQYIHMQERIMTAVNTAEHSPTDARRFDAELKHTADVLKLDNALQSALANQEFTLYYQPIVDLETDQIAGCEALIRWNHPELGLVPPNEFIPIAEENGTIIDIGSWIVEEASTALTRLEKVVDQPLYMSINLSARQFEDEGLINNIDRILQATDVDRSRIKFEITESLLMSNPDLAAISLQELKDLGVTIAMDDFGTGYSSFSYLNRFPIDTLKIDRSFVSTMCDNDKSATIVWSLTELAHNLHMNVIAEGVETAEELKFLKQFTADYGQGYHYSRPIIESDFSKLLADQSDLQAAS